MTQFRRVESLSVLAVLAFLAARPSDAGLLHPDLDLSLSADFRSAYISSSSSVVETKPVTSQCLTGDFGLGAFGRIEGYFWIVSALSGQKDDYRRRAFNEIETSVAYAYDWRFAKDWSLDSLAGPVLNPAIGYDSYDSGEITHEIRAIQALSNPYLTPYYDLMAAYHPSSWMRINTGFRHVFTFFDGTLSLTPFWHVTWGDRDRYEAKFGPEPESEVLGFSPMCSMAGVWVRYYLRKHFSLYLRLQQYDVIDAHARDYEKNRDVCWAVCDYPFAVLGATLHF